MLEAGAPSGTFVLDASSTRPSVLVSAGVGLKPMVAMLHALGESKSRVIFVHGARDGAHHSLRDEVRSAVKTNPDARLDVTYSQPSSSDVEGHDYHSTGHLRSDLLASRRICLPVP